MKKTIEKVTSNYGAPTPAKWRKLGDALLSVSAFITAYGISEDAHMISYVALGIGVAGKFLTNFFKKEA